MIFKQVHQTTLNHLMIILHLRTSSSIYMRLLLQPLLDVLEVVLDPARILVQIPDRLFLQFGPQRTDRGRHVRAV